MRRLESIPHDMAEQERLVLAALPATYEPLQPLHHQSILALDLYALQPLLLAARVRPPRDVRASAPGTGCLTRHLRAPSTTAPALDCITNSFLFLTSVPSSPSCWLLDSIPHETAEQVRLVLAALPATYVPLQPLHLHLTASPIHSCSRSLRPPAPPAGCSSPSPTRWPSKCAWCWLPYPPTTCPFNHCICT